MSALVTQLGINWKLLIAQGVNFFILLLVLTFVVYRPLVRIMEERRKKIEFGLKGAEEAERRLAEIDRLKSERLNEAEKSAFAIVSSAENDAKKRGQEVIAETNKKADALMADAMKLAEHKKLEQFAELEKQAKSLIKEALIKTVKLDPKSVDEKLIDEALRAVKK